MREHDLGNRSPLLPTGMSRDDAAKLLKTSPEALTKFEAAYGKLLDVEEPAGFFQTNSKQAAAQAHVIDGDAPKEDAGDPDIDPDQVRDQIVNELLAQTSVYHFDGKLTQTTRKALPALPEGAQEVTNEMIRKMAPSARPQLTGTLMPRDFEFDTYVLLLDNYRHAMDESLPKDKRMYQYHVFRQGLDIMDLDPVMYAIMDRNQSSMGFWLPKLVNACMEQDFFKIPATTIAKVPLTLLQLTRQDYTSLTPMTLSIVDKWAMKAFDLDENGDYFIKTGTYSSKFDFRNCRVTTPKEVKELGEYLLYIDYQAHQMAAPLTSPGPMYGVSTTTEWVVREYIPDKENNPTIYKGLPLHTEYRIFIDCDTDRIIGFHPYWDPRGMKAHFGKEENRQNPHMVHDYIVYTAYEDALMGRYNDNILRVLDAVRAILPGLDLPGQWSLDIMQNGDDFWLIDMAVAAQSTFYDQAVPPALRKPVKEDWIPKLGEVSPPWSIENLLPPTTAPAEGGEA